MWYSLMYRIVLELHQWKIQVIKSVPSYIELPIPVYCGPKVATIGFIMTPLHALYH